jgi:hypothetical protein
VSIFRLLDLLPNVVETLEFDAFTVLGCGVLRQTHNSLRIYYINAMGKFCVNVFLISNNYFQSEFFKKIELIWVDKIAQKWNGHPELQWLELHFWPRALARAVLGITILFCCAFGNFKQKAQQNKKSIKIASFYIKKINNVIK